MSEKESIDHTCTDKVTCPYCGSQWRDDEPTETVVVMTCDRCGEEYNYWAALSVSFSTSRIDSGDGYTRVG